MYISRLQLINWRNFQKIEVPLQQRVFLVGANATGKSNFLDALKFLRDIAETGSGGFQAAVKTRGGISKLRCLNVHNQFGGVQISVDISEQGNPTPAWSYTIAFKRKGTGDHKPVITKEEISKNGDLLLSRPDKADKEDPTRLSQTLLEQSSQNKEFRPLSEFLSKISYFHLIPQLLRFPDSFRGQGPLISQFGLDFLKQIAEKAPKTRENRLKKINQILRSAVPQLSGLQFEPDETGQPHLTARFDHWRPLGGKQNELDFSDGTLRLIALLWTILDTQGVILLEEPELSLHSGIVEKLPGLFSLVQKIKTGKRQIIITTHNEHLLDDRGVALSEILCLQPTDSGTRCFPASDNRQWRELLKQGLTPGEIVIPETRPQNIDLFTRPLQLDFEEADKT